MKCKVIGSIKNKDQTIFYDTVAIWQAEKGILSWKEQDSLNTTLSIDFKKKQLIRENKEFKILLTFNQKKDTIMNCKLKSMDQSLDLEVKIISLKEEKDSLFLTYETYLDQERIDTFYLEIKIFRNEV